MFLKTLYFNLLNQIEEDKDFLKNVEMLEKKAVNGDFDSAKKIYDHFDLKRDYCGIYSLYESGFYPMLGAYYLHRYYALGTCVKRDLKKSKEYLFESAKLGYRDAIKAIRSSYDLAEIDFIIQNKRLCNYFSKSRFVVIPEGVEIIGANAFYLSNVIKVVLPKSLKCIEKGAFDDQLRLIEVVNLSDNDFSKAFKNISKENKNFRFIKGGA